MLIEKMNLRNADEMKATSTASEDVDGRSHSQIVGIRGRQSLNALGMCISTSTMDSSLKALDLRQHKRSADWVATL